MDRPWKLTIVEAQGEHKITGREKPNVRPRNGAESTKIILPILCQGVVLGLLGHVPARRSQGKPAFRELPGELGATGV